MSIYKLSQHPDVLRRVREEVQEFVGAGRPTYEDIKKMKFLRAFINGQSDGRFSLVGLADEEEVADDVFGLCL